MLENKHEKNAVVKELKCIYRSSLGKMDVSLNNKIENFNIKEIPSLNNENIRLKQHIKNIDMKFDYIIKENREIKEYIRIKTEDYENNIHELVSNLYEQFKFFNGNNLFNNQSKTKNKSKNTNVFKNNDKMSSHYIESPNSNNDYSDNVKKTEGSNSNRNNLNLNSDDYVEYNGLDSSKLFPSSKNANESTHRVLF